MKSQLASKGLAAMTFKTMDFTLERGSKGQLSRGTLKGKARAALNRGMLEASSFLVLIEIFGK